MGRVAEQGDPAAPPPAEWVAVDQQIGDVLTCAGPHPDGIVELVDVGQFGTYADDLATQSISQCRCKHHLQAAAVYRVLRMTVAAVDAARLPEQQGAVRVVISDRARRHSDPGELVAQSQFGEFAHGMRQQVDPHAERSEVGAFDDGDVDATGVQRQRGGEPADAGPRDENVVGHVLSLGLIVL